MEDKEEHTSISIKKKTWKKLNGAKQEPKETFDDVISSLWTSKENIDFIPNVQEENKEWPPKLLRRSGYLRDDDDN